MYNRLHKLQTTQPEGKKKGNSEKEEVKREERKCKCHNVNKMSEKSRKMPDTISQKLR